MHIYKNKAALWGSIFLILGAMGHLVVVDFSALHAEANFVSWTPASPLPALHNTTLSFGPFGKTNAFLAFSGFSMWLALSLLFIAAHNLLVFRLITPGHKIRTLLISINFVMCIVFLFVAVTCFIYPAAIAGGGAALSFALALRKEQALFKAAKSS